MELTFDVNFTTQTTTRTDSNSPVSASVGYLTATFTVTGAEDGVVLTPIFTVYGSPYIPAFTQTGVEEVTCVVPANVLLANKFTASLFSYDIANEIRVTATGVEVQVERSGYTYPPVVPVQDKSVYEQILETSTSAMEIAQSVRDDADAGKFTGVGATVNVNSTTTGEAGTDAQVTNVGTEEDVLLDFVIPRGEKGDTPEKGVDYWTDEDKEEMIADVVASDTLKSYLDSLLYTETIGTMSYDSVNAYYYYNITTTGVPVAVYSASGLNLTFDYTKSSTTVRIISQTNIQGATVAFGVF